MELKTKLKLSLLFISIAYPATQALAKVQDHPHQADFAGWNMGAGLGITSLFADITTSTQIGNEANNAKNKVYGYGPMGSLFVGKNWVMDNNYFYGLELGVNIFDEDDVKLVDTNQTSINTTATLENPDIAATASYSNALTTKQKVERNTFEPYLDLKFGFLPGKDALLFLRAGIEYNALALITSGTYQANGINSAQVGQVNVAAASTTYPFNIKQGKDKIGFRLGAGMEYLLTPNLGVGANYVFTFYQHLQKNASDSALEVSCDVLEGCMSESTEFNNNGRAKVYDQQALVQLIYHFGKN